MGPTVRFLIALSALVYTSAIAGERPPYAKIEEAYFVCMPSRTLQGGIFGKGPIRKFGPQPGECASAAWQRISREQFKDLAVQWYSIDWEREIPFFSSRASETKPGAAR